MWERAGVRSCEVFLWVRRVARAPRAAASGSGESRWFLMCSLRDVGIACASADDICWESLERVWCGMPDHGIHLSFLLARRV